MSSHADQAGPSSTAPGTLAGRIRVRIIRTPPAPLMDGFDVRDMLADQIHDVESRTASYLVIAGYAVRVRADDDHPHAVNLVERRRRGDNRLAEEGNTRGDETAD